MIDTAPPAAPVGLTEVPSRRAQIAQTLRAAVVAGEMQAGVVYSAPALAARFGVSPTPVREAMIGLAKEGLVEVVRNKGFRITEPTISEIRDMLELRLLIEVPTARRIAEFGITDRQRSRLRPLAEATLRTAQRKDMLGHVTADLEFHLELLSLAGNSELVEVVRVLRSRSRLYGLHAEEKQTSLIDSAHEHLELVELVSAGRAADVEVLLRRHISRVGTNWAPASVERVERLSTDS